MFNFLSLEWKRFLRSKNFTQNLFKKIFSYIGFFFMALYIFGIFIGGFFILKKEHPNQDIFKALNSFAYLLFFIVFYILSFVSADTFEVKPFMTLPVKKKKIIKFYLLKSILHPLTLIIILNVFILGILLINQQYDALRIMIWFFAVGAVILIISILMLLSEKTQFLRIFSSFLLIILVTNAKRIKSLLEPVGDYFYSIYFHPSYSLLILFLAILVYYLSYIFFKHRFYLDVGIGSKKSKKGRFEALELNWIEKYGKIGTFIKNDIRLITRNPRTKQLLYSALVMVLFGIFILKSDVYKKSSFMYIYWAFLLTGYFIVGYGAMVPSWDGKYYKLLMSQNIKYKEYLEAKWWFMVVSVVFMTLISLPLVLLNKEFFWFLIAMAIFNIGFHSFAVLFTGLLNKKAIDLDQKVKAFQNNQDFNAKIFLYSLLRIIFPAILFLLIKKFFGLSYAVSTLSLIGVIGLLFKKILLEKIAQLYAKRKYDLIESYSSEDD